ncbi:hypothetical protein [Pseudoalteromonas carrageenovora]|uniref:hypothetical protein n=1 Tax=Pseudoalteromonas carrageenovora TaxID=227 RepID=UPI0026E4304C|nr:hypothetical protein [Pseudoalteromonas carrageenovora]MDO6546072.1 hypothetical protein [Pseudoalteromonas carrageenovora]MDO6831144.1 hypothetical protein [Pseudoalteromonas carrageenovora]
MNSEVTINFILVPAMIAYLLILLAFADMKRNKAKHLVFPLRDAAIATLSLDFIVVIPNLMGSLNVDFGMGGISFSLVSFLLLAFHFFILILSERISAVVQQSEAKTQSKRLMNLIVVTYIGLLCLMTNAFSMQYVLNGLGGV